MTVRYRLSVKYDPNQPRHPAGTSEGGRFAADHGEGRTTFKKYRDNPGGDWETRQQEKADALQKEADNPHTIAGRGLAGATTLTGRGELPVSMLEDLEGVMGEDPRPGNPKFDNLVASVDKNGWQDTNPVMVWVNHKGEAYIAEGNNRVAVAALKQVRLIRVEVQWRNGAEKADGPLSEERVNEVLSEIPVRKYDPNQPRHPAGSSEGGRFAPGPGAGGFSTTSQSINEVLGVPMTFNGSYDVPELVDVGRRQATQEAADAWKLMREKHGQEQDEAHDMIPNVELYQAGEYQLMNLALRHPDEWADFVSRYEEDVYENAGNWSFDKYAAAQKAWEASSMVNVTKKTPNTDLMSSEYESASMLAEDMADGMRSYTPTLPKNLTLYRSFRNKEFFDDPAKMIGRTFTDDGFISTTMDASFANRWGGGGGYNPKLILRTKTTGKERGLHLFKRDYSGVDDPYEFEILLPPGTSFKINRITEIADNGFFVVDADIVDPTAKKRDLAVKADRKVPTARELPEPNPEKFGWDEQEFAAMLSVQRFDPSQPRDKNGRWTDAGAMHIGPGNPPVPGKTFIAFRAGTETGATLENRNAGDSLSVSQYLVGTDDMDKPSFGNPVTHLHVFEVTVDKPFGKYDRMIGGKNQDGLTADGSVGMDVSKAGVVLSFGTSGYTAKPVASIPVERIRQRLSDKHDAADREKNGFPYGRRFDGHGSKRVYDVVNELADERLSKKFDPNQPRDENGRWTATGVGSADALFDYDNLPEEFEGVSVISANLPPNVLGRYDPERHKIMISSNSATRANHGTMPEAIKKFHEAKWFSNDHPNHLIWHELAHAKTREKMGRQLFTVRAKDPKGWYDYKTEKRAFSEDVARQVSDYAAVHWSEFIAETYAARRGGKTFSEAVNTMYTELEGPDE